MDMKDLKIAVAGTVYDEYQNNSSPDMLVLV